MKDKNVKIDNSAFEPPKGSFVFALLFTIRNQVTNTTIVIWSVLFAMPQPDVLIAEKAQARITNMSR